MSQQFENPYASPQVADIVSAHPSEPRLGIYQPRLAPRDVFDFLAGVFVVVPGSFALYGLPVFVIYVVGAPMYLGAVAMVVIWLTAILALLTGVFKVTVSPEHITAHRRVLWDGQFTWDKVTRVRELSRLEAMIYVFMQPHRSCPYSFTFRDYVRVEAGRRYFLFPPKTDELESFLLTIESMRASGHLQPPSL